MAKPTLTAEETAAKNEVLACLKTSEDHSKPIRRQWDDQLAHYHGHRGLSEALQRATPPDRDTLLRDAVQEWGTDLVIPFAFSTVETILPRAVSNRPRMLLLPKDDDAERSVANMRDLLDQQQQQCQYELRLEETAKSGFIQGLGVEKMYWLTRYGKRPSLTQTLMRNPQSGAMEPMWVEGPLESEALFDDWTVEDVEIRNFFWDPFGHFLGDVGEAGACRYVIHRTWRDHRYCRDRLERGDWATEAAQQLKPEDLTAYASTNKWGETFGTSNRVAGYTAGTPSGSEQHEVLEFHDGERVITILDREVPVVTGRNPARHQQIPFSVFRPTTPAVKQLPGISVIQPIAQLLREISTLRSQRRDNAALKLAQVFAYSDGAIEKDDLQFFPGAAIPVHGEPRDFLYPVQVGDIPNSSYNEEDRIVQDIERTSGISDSVTGADASQGAAATATGVQLVQAAANVRIQRQTRRLEVETVTRMAGQAVAWNQQMIVRRQQMMLKVPRLPKPGEIGPVYDTKVLTPPELWGRFACDVEGGSTAPKNMPQQIQLAQTLGGMFANDPSIDQRALKVRQLELCGFAHPEAYMAPDEPPLNGDILDRLKQAGVDPGLIAAAVGASQRENPPQGRGEASEGPQPEPVGAEAGSNGSGLS